MELVGKKVADRAVTDLNRAVERLDFMKKDERAQVHCALAFALLSSGKANEAAKEFTAAAQAGGCQFKAASDRLGIDFFQAYARYRDGSIGNVRDALKLFTKLAGKASGALGATMKDLAAHGARAVRRRALQPRRCPRRGRRAQGGEGARGPRRLARAQPRGHRPRRRPRAQAERALEALGGRPAEALMNLGIYYDRQGDPKKALEATAARPSAGCAPRASRAGWTSRSASSAREGGDHAHSYDEARLWRA